MSGSSVTRSNSMDKAHADHGLAHWRKKLSKAAPATIPRSDWKSVYDILLSQHADWERLEYLSLLLVVLRQLKRALDTSSSDTSEISADFHETLAPSFAPGAIHSLSNPILEGLDSSNKPEHSRALEVLTAASSLSTTLPPSSSPSSSSSHSTDNFLIPLFRHIVKQGLSQRWVLVAMSALVPAIPTNEVSDDVLHNLLDDLDVLEFAPIRATLIVEIVQARWKDHARQHGGNELEFHRIVYDPFLPSFDPSTISANTWQNVQRYLYPALSSLKSPSGRGFLQYIETLPVEHAFDADARLECWITIAAAGVQSKQLGIRSLDETRMKQAIFHADASVRLKAFIVYSQNEDILCERAVAGIKASFRYNEALSGTGQRSEFASAVYNFFSFLHQETLVTRRAIVRVQEGHKAVKGTTLPDLSTESPCPRYTIISNPEAALDTALQLRQHVLEHWISPGLEMATRRPVARILVALMVLKLYLDAFGQEDGVQEAIFTPKTVEQLLACQGSEFNDVRSKARAILDSAMIRLPTYESIDTTASRELLSSALASLNHPRKTQAEHGHAVVSIVFDKQVRHQGDEVEYLTKLVDRLDDHLRSAEADLVGAMEKTPLHGLLTVLCDLVRSLNIDNSAAEAKWRTLFHRMLYIIDRVWAVTRPVISLKSAGTNDDKDRPDHEIARAYEVVGDNDADGEDDESADVTGLLSGCWRATTGAGELLSVIMSIPLVPPKTDDGIWSREEVDLAGHRFLTWMHEVRHRGTFTKLATAFASMVQAVKRVETLRDLCLSWLEHELSTIRNEALSTTRRSAALPYSILSLITSDQNLSDRGVNALIEMADVHSATNDICKIHAFNVLQVVLPDAKQAKFLDRYFEKAVMTAIGAFESPNWNVRNVGLILFATLIHRSLNLAKSQDMFEYRTPSPTRQTFFAWHSKYPAILPHLTKYLEEHEPSSTANQHSPLFPILIIVRSLRYSESGHAVQQPLVPVVDRLLASREWQVRKVAAQALASLLSPKEALFRATNWTSTLDACSDNNELHGRYQLLGFMFAHVIDWTKVDNLAKKQIEQSLFVALDRHGASPLLDISNTVIGCVSSYLASTTPMNPDLRSRTANLAKRTLFASPSSQHPVQGLVLWTSTMFLLDHAPSTENLLGLLARGNSSPNVTQLPALWTLQGLMDKPALQKLADLSIFQQVLSLARSIAHEDAVRITAMDTLHQAPWSREVLEAVDAETRRGLVKDMSAVVRGTKYVPVREAALPALAWGMAWLSSTLESDISWTVMSQQLLKSSHEDESQPARDSALTALRHLGTLLFPAVSPDAKSAYSMRIDDRDLMSLHQVLDRLLNDDDEDIRNGASAIIREGLLKSSPVCRDRADELWGDWLQAHIATLAPESAKLWIEWLSSFVKADQASVADNTPIAPTPVRPDVLFEVEPSNLFRDSTTDAARALRILRPFLDEMTDS